MSLKTRHCDECSHFDMGHLSDCECPIPKPTCTKGHKPRFYNSLSPMDDKWGYKRRCTDFEEELP